MSGTDIAYGATCAYAMSGTEIGWAAREYGVSSSVHPSRPPVCLPPCIRCGTEIAYGHYRAGGGRIDIVSPQLPGTLSQIPVVLGQIPVMLRQIRVVEGRFGLFKARRGRVDTVPLQLPGVFSYWHRYSV
eukprot:3569898-Rhodomonas_salina.1